MNLTREIYSVTRLFPDTEKFGMVLQMNRAAISIPSDVAEGAGRDSKKEFMQYLNIAMGSCYELETQVILSRDFGYLLSEKTEEVLLQIYEIQKMVVGLKNYLRGKTY